jgi:hypothetical protein
MYRFPDFAPGVLENIRPKSMPTSFRGLEIERSQDIARLILRLASDPTHFSNVY